VGWQFGSIGVGYQFDFSHQDNRQPGRENADFRVRNHSANVALMSWTKLSLMLDAGLERAASEESGEIVRGRRGGASADLRLTRTTALTLQGNHATSLEQLTGISQKATSAQAQLSQRVMLLRRRGGATQGQLFARFAGSRMQAVSFDNVPFRRDNWTINTGINLSVF
jgi:hypothetical protein